MQFQTLLMLALTGATTTVLAAPQGSPAQPNGFKSDIQTQIQTIQGYVQNNMKDFAQNVDQKTLLADYSSTGRYLDFWLGTNFVSAGSSACPQAQAGQPLPPQATTPDQANQYLQQVQLALIAVSQDAINNDFTAGISDACNAYRLYGSAAINTPTAA